MNQSKSQDILAKLLSNENITVTRGKVRTASFDIRNRVLTLPRWKDMSQSVEEMLMLHEVGHALYTSADAYGVVFTEKKHLKDYANVIEDVRIEKLMKQRYPGSRKSFNIGYGELIEKDFFGVKKNSDQLDKMLLIDRINIFYKVGFSSGVNFTDVEQDFIRRIDLCKTEEDVIKLAQEIYDHSAQEEAEKEMGPGSSDDDEEIDPNDIDWDNTEASEDGDGEDDDKPKKKIDMSKLSEEQKQKIEDKLKSKTVDKFDEKLQQEADTSIEHFYFDAEFEVSCKNTIVPYKTVIKELKEANDPEYLSRFSEKFKKFKAESAPMINYLIKEFEMRKSATAYKRSKISRLGQLDPRKLYAYKIKEDLFKQITTVQDGKKHGLVFLLDWSGSMNNCIDETIEQVINLAMFCQRSQIPYQVFAFTDGYNNYYDYYTPTPASSVTKRNDNGLDRQDGFNLLEFFSSKMTTREFNDQIQLLLAKPYRRGKYRLNGTPLNHALLYMVDYIGTFRKETQAEKVSFITLTDGESNTLNSSKGIKNGPSYVYDDNHMYRKIDARSFLRDPITKKEYEFTDNASEQTAAIMNLIRDRHNITSIGFYIMDPRARGASTFVRHNVIGSTSVKISVRDKIVDGLKKNRYAILNQISGRDEYYIIPSDQRIATLDFDTVDADQSAASIARQMSKIMNTQKQSRIVLNAFIQQVA